MVVGSWRVEEKSAARCSRRPALGLLFALALGCAPWSALAEGSPAGHGEFDIMESFMADKGLVDSQAYRRSLEAALLSEQRIGGVMRLDGGGIPKMSALAAMEAARKAGCRFLLDLRLEVGTEGDVKVAWEFFDTATGKKSSEGRFEKPLPGRATLASSFWSEVLVDLDAMLSAPRPTVTLEIYAPAGTLIDGAGPRRIVPASGRLAIPFDVPLVVAWTARIPGQFPQHGSIDVGSGSARLHIEPRRFSVSLGAVGLSFPEASVAYAVGDHLSLRLGLEQYFLGLHLTSPSNNSPVRFISSLPLLIPYAGVELSSFLPSNPFRIYGTAEALARLAFLPDGKVYIDPVAPVGLKLRLGWDWGLDRAIRLWMEAGANFYLWADPQGFAASAGSSGGSVTFGGTPPFPWVPAWAAELPIGAIGLRIGL